MAGLCKPFAAGRLAKALHDEIGLPIHFHTHDTSGAALASCLEAARHGASIVDASMAPFAGLTSQPSLNALVEATRNTDLDTGLDPEPLRQLTHYWGAVREHYSPFECGMKAPDADSIFTKCQVVNSPTYLKRPGSWAYRPLGRCVPNIRRGQSSLVILSR